MNAIIRYLAGGALALSSQGVFALSFGLPSALDTAAQPMKFAQVQQVQVAAAKPAALQEVDRTRKGDRLPAFDAAPTSSEFVSNDPVARKLKPLLKPAKREVEQKLPEGCNAAISPLSDRVAASQASNCITALELPYKVASAQ